MPLQEDGISDVNLSVDTSTNGSSNSTLSFSFLSHLMILALKMLSPNLADIFSSLSPNIIVFGLYNF